MALGLGSSLIRGGASLLTFVKDNLKLYLDFKSSRSDTLAFPSEGSTSFDGDNDYITIGDDTTLDITSAITMSCWIKPMEINAHSFVAGRDDGTNRNYYLEVYTDEKFYWTCNGLSDTSVASTTTFTSGTWYHIAGVYDGANMILYVNGIAEDTDASTGSIDNDDASFTIGAREAGADRFFKGNISNLGLWSRALSPEEVQSVMNKSYSQLGSVEKTSLVMWQSLDSASGGVVQPHDGETLGDEIITLSVTDTWSGSNLTVNEASTEQAHSGTQSLKFTTNTNSGAKGVSQSFTSVLNALYKFDFWVYSAHSSIEVIVGQGDGSGTSTSQYFSIASNQWVNIIGYYTELGGGASSYFKMCSNTASVTFYVDDISLKRVTSNTGLVTGATTTTSVYGLNAPLLPRAIDIAESFADAIGNGSASFDGDDDFIQVDNIALPNLEPYTITAWIKTTDVDQTQAIALWGDQASYERRALIIYNGSSGSDWTLVASTNGDNAQGATNVTEGEWTHASITVIPSTKAYKIYMNGILDGSGTFSNNLVAFSNSTLLIGKSYYGEFFEGNIAGVGIWYGELTQSQIQSVMESTSYAKIPADVKSTTTEKLPSPDLTSSSGLVLSQGSTGTLSIDTTAGTITATNDVQDGYITWSGAGLSNGALYKLEVVVDSYTGGRFRTTSGWGNGTSFYPSVGTNTQYFIGNATSAFAIQIDDGAPAEFVVSRISVKEVTNDLVAYYSLDADSEVKALSFAYADKIMFTRLTFTGAFSIMCWVNADTNTTYKRLFADSSPPSGTNDILTKDSAGQITIRINGNYGAIIGSVPNNEWVHLAYTRDGSGNIKTYLNGVASATSTSTDTFTLDNIGGDGGGAVMKMSSASMYNVKKSASEVLSIYNDGIGGDESSNSGLQLYYKLDNATTVTDLSGNGNNGAVTGATLISGGTTDSVNNNDGVLY